LTDIAIHSIVDFMNIASSAADIATFVRVADAGSFAAVAAETGLTPSGVSKIVSRLEDRLGVKLMHRTTRRLSLTPEGETMLARGRDILASIEAAEAEVTAARGKPKGLIRVNTGTAFARHRLAPVLPEFHARYPDIRLEIAIADMRVDLAAQQVDVSIRIGPPGETEYIVRPIGFMRRMICASPAYLARHGTPRHPEELAKHNCLVLTGLARLAEWPFEVDGRSILMKVNGSVTCDSAELIREMVLQGLGIARFGDFIADDALADGRLVPLLVESNRNGPQQINALIQPARRMLPRIRAFTDFLVERCGASGPAQPLTGESGIAHTVAHDRDT
jgi:DNA-binding transcriptional LysR family regulator